MSPVELHVDSVRSRLAPPPAGGPTSGLLAALRAPDRLLDPGEAPRPARVLGGLGLGALGCLGFALAPALGPGIAGPAASLGWIALPPLLFALCFPPLVLAAALQGRPPGLRALAALALSAPAVAGLSFLALSPLLLLYGLSSTEPGTLRVLWVGIGLLGAALGVVGAVRTAEAAGAPAPGRWLVRGHALFTLWTAAVLAGSLA